MNVGQSAGAFINLGDITELYMHSRHTCSDHHVMKTQVPDPRNVGRPVSSSEAAPLMPPAMGVDQLVPLLHPEFSVLAAYM